ncbi:hypothetical protein P9112_005363 [Eukaryota sp. TZLM1-RC]
MTDHLTFDSSTTDPTVVLEKLQNTGLLDKLCHTNSTIPDSSSCIKTLHQETTSNHPFPPTSTSVYQQNETRPNSVKKNFLFYWTRQQSAEPTSRRKLHERPDLEAFAQTMEMKAITEERIKEQERLADIHYKRDCIREAFKRRKEQREYLESSIGLDQQRLKLSRKMNNTMRKGVKEDDDVTDLDLIDQFESRWDLENVCRNGIL